MYLKLPLLTCRISLILCHLFEYSCTLNVYTLQQMISNITDTRTHQRTKLLLRLIAYMNYLPFLVYLVYPYGVKKSLQMRYHWQSTCADNHFCESNTILGVCGTSKWHTRKSVHVYPLLSSVSLWGNINPVVDRSYLTKHHLQP